MKIPPLRLVALEITRTCKLACKHCRGDSHNEQYPDELSLAEIKAIIDNIAAFSQPIIIITGGEPLTRADVFNIASYSSSKGLRTVLATCGHLLNDEIVQKLLSSGISRISVSIDGASSTTHDNFRGVPGAFDAAISGLKTARKYGLDFQINSTLTTLNVRELEALHDLAVNLGAVGFHPFLLVPMGRGEGLTDCALSGDEYETTLNRIFEIASTSPIEIKPTCSPHYSRVIKQNSVETFTKIERDGAPDKSTITAPAYSHSSNGHRSNRYKITKGCLGGQGFVFISHMGKVQMCGFLEIEAGNLRTCGFDFKHIWETSEFFNKIRDIDNYHGKCSFCEYRFICGGCRARAYYKTGNYLAEEPQCIYLPGKKQPV